MARYSLIPLLVIVSLINGDGFARERKDEVDPSGRGARIVKGHDRNGDGKLTLEEYPERHRDKFKSADINGDGYVEPSEQDAFFKRVFRKGGKNNQRDPARNRGTQGPAATYADIEYGSHKKQRFDLWLAKNDKAAPLLIYIHGGGFRGGDKRGVNRKLLKKMLENGVSFASLNYRLTDVGPYPMQMHDCARALQFIRHNAAKYNIDPKRVGAFGGSAGSGISQWLAFHEDLADPQSDDPICRQSTRLVGVAPYNAQTSYDPRFIKELFNTKEVESALIAFFGMKGPDDIHDKKFHQLFEDASPINHLTKDDPPVFFHYNQANTPLPENSRGNQHIHHPRFGLVLKEKMDKLGIECTVRLKEESPQFPVEEVAGFFFRHFGMKKD